MLCPPHSLQCKLRAAHASPMCTVSKTNVMPTFSALGHRILSHKRDWYPLAVLAALYLIAGAITP